MRNLLVAAALLALAPDLAGGQSGSAGSRPGAKQCEDCPRERAEIHMDIARMARLTSELSSVRRILHDEGRRMSAEVRRDHEARARHLESELERLGARLGPGVTHRVLQDVGPAMVEVRRAMRAGIHRGSGEVEPTRFPGWIGITLDAPATVEMRGGDVYWRFFDHPAIVSVDPSSPADRAGIRQGDVLLAYDGKDVRREIAMNRLLQPGRTVRVRVRVRRDNEVRDMPVKVAPVRELAWREWTPGDMVVPRPGFPRSPGSQAEVWAFPAPEPGHPPEPPSPLPAPGSIISVVRFNGLAGAHMETISPGLGEAIGVERGVLVISVAPGVPAYEAGLSDGDVILKADGRDVASVHDLRRVLAKAHDRAVKLDVSRKGRVRQVTLRW